MNRPSSGNKASDRNPRNEDELGPCPPCNVLPPPPDRNDRPPGTTPMVSAALRVSPGLGKSSGSRYGGSSPASADATCDARVSNSSSPNRLRWRYSSQAARGAPPLDTRNANRTAATFFNSLVCPGVSVDATSFAATRGNGSLSSVPFPVPETARPFPVSPGIHVACPLNGVWETYGLVGIGDIPMAGQFLPIDVPSRSTSSGKSGNANPLLKMISIATPAQRASVLRFTNRLFF